MGPSRLPRFTRAPRVTGIELTPRDKRIIHLVHQHRFLRSSQIAALLPDRSQQLLRRLQLLYHHGFLERPRAQLDYFHCGGSRHIAYGLGNKDAALLQTESRLQSHTVRWGPKNRSVGRIFLEHALLVSEVMVNIELACREKGTIKLLIDDQLPLPTTMTNQRRPFQWRVGVSAAAKLGVIPDRVFALEYHDRSGNRERAFFFLEADRGTMPVKRRSLAQTSFYRKLLAYEATWSQSLHRTLFGFHRFRLLTVTTSPSRLQSIISACAELKSGHGLFLFADRAALAKPADTLSRIWRTVRPGETASLLD